MAGPNRRSNAVARRAHAEALKEDQGPPDYWDCDEAHRLVTAAVTFGEAYYGRLWFWQRHIGNNRLAMEVLHDMANEMDMTRFRSFAERYVIARAPHFRVAHEAEDAWECILRAKTAYKQIDSCATSFAKDDA